MIVLSRSRSLRDDRGSVTAEFAAVLPAVILVLAFALGALRLGGEQLGLQASVAQIARTLGRGGALDLQGVKLVAPDAAVSSVIRGNLPCVQARAPATLGILSGITLVATSCALDDGQ